MSPRSVSALAVAAGLAAAVTMVGRFIPASAADQGTRPAATTPAAPVFLQWPLPPSGKAYGSIDGARLWQHVKESGDIAERYRQQGHPQFWGIIAGTSGDAEEAQWLLGKYKQIGLADTDIQTVNFFHPQWAPDSWAVVATADGKSTTLTSAQPAYATAGNARTAPATPPRASATRTRRGTAGRSSP